MGIDWRQASQLGVVVILMLPALCHAGDEPAQRWRERFGLATPLAETTGVCTGTIGDLPTFRVRPAQGGQHLVRVSLPFAPGALPDGMGLMVIGGGQRAQADVRPLTFHPGRPRSVRRALLTFPFTFTTRQWHAFDLQLTASRPTVQASFSNDGDGWSIAFGDMVLRMTATGVRSAGGAEPAWSARLVAPPPSAGQTAVPEIVESGPHYLWVRLLVYDQRWPRILELQADSLGTVAVQAHVQRLAPGDGTAPELGWIVDGLTLRGREPHPFQTGTPCTLITADGVFAVSFPAAPGTRRGGVAVAAGAGTDTVRYTRCQPEDQVPMQQASWRRLSFVIGRAGHTPRGALLEPQLELSIAPAAFDAVYGTGAAADLALWPELDDLLHYTHAAIKRSAAVGDDFGNLTAFHHDQDHGATFGMNRLNHCPAIFEESWRSGDRQLRDTAVLWCSNMYDLSIWWGDTDDVGGTRYNNANAMGRPEHQEDHNFMWRSNSAVHFCTKGYASFLTAYEETGDPRMLAALRTQVEYAKRHIHADQGECRNIGAAADFVHLHQATGLDDYRQQALRLFHELRSKLSPDNLFSQSGRPIVADGPFIDDDQHGYEAPFAKPYILGYALAGLPQLAHQCPGEEQLLNVVRAVADFLARSQDPVGGWRYPHPASSRVLLSHAIEHAEQLARAATVLAARGEPIDELLDAIERTLQAQVKGYERTGSILAGLSGWESATGAIPPGKTIYDLYAKPAQRAPSRDYTEGALSVGESPPEGLVYFGSLLRFYLTHRPAERLLAANVPLRTVLARTEDRRVRLVPQPQRALVRLECPADPAVGLALQVPAWIARPLGTTTPQALDEMAVEWQRDADRDAVWYHLDHEQATFTACFVPHVDYVECSYTSWPKPGAHLLRPALPMSEADQREAGRTGQRDAPARSLAAQGSITGDFGVGLSARLIGSAFAAETADLQSRLWLLVGGSWQSLASRATNDPRQARSTRGPQSIERLGSGAGSGALTDHATRPAGSVVACTSTDDRWVVATVAESPPGGQCTAQLSLGSLCAQGSAPLRTDGPTTVRVRVYLMEGNLEQLKLRCARDWARWVATPPAPPFAEPRTDTYGVRRRLPTFNDARVRRMHFPLAWRNAFDGPATSDVVLRVPAAGSSNGHPAASIGRAAAHGPPAPRPHSEWLPGWRRAARRVYLASLSTPPPRARFEPRILATEDRGSYVAQQVACNINGDCRIKAYLLVPKGAGPFPGILALHDHGAHFTIGKEKVVRPFAEPTAVINDAQQWVQQCYGGRWIGDELAQRGYVVLAIDLLFWGDRGRFEGAKYEDQQALASNMLQLGYSWAGYNVWDDLRSAEFLQGLPEVDPARIGCLGLSMGGNRAWHLAAATDIIQVAAAICWMGDTPSLTSAGNNQTTGQSALSMTHPGLRNWLDYADVASIACPKPMLLLGGVRDGLFPVAGVQAAYCTMHRVWADQGVAERLVCKLWDVPHEFNEAMQRQTFDWLDHYLKPLPSAIP